MGGQSSKGGSGEEETDGEGRKRRRKEEDPQAHKSPTTARKARPRHPKKKARAAESQPPPPVLRTFKVCLAPDDVRRFTIPLGLWAEFEALLRSQYPWAFDHAEGRVAIRYEDESGDLCLLSSQPEWDALCHNPLLGRIVRVFINHEMPRFIDGLHYTIKAEKMEEVDDEAATERGGQVEDESQSLQHSPSYNTRSKEEDAENEIENEQAVYSGETLLPHEEELAGLADFSVAELSDPVPSASVSRDDEEAWPVKESVYGSMMVIEADESGWTTTTTTTAASVVESEEGEHDRDQHDGAYDKDGNYYEQLRRQQEEVESQAQAADSSETTVPTIVVEQVDAGDLRQEGEVSTTFCPSSPLQVDASSFPAARKKNGARRRLRRSSSK